MNSRFMSLLFISAGLLFAGLIARNGNLAWMALPFLIYIGMGLLRAPAKETVRLRAARRVNRVMKDDCAAVEVELTVQNTGEALDQVYLFDMLTEEVHLLDEHAGQWTALAGGDTETLRYSFLEKRGSYRWETMRAAVSDPFGLVESMIEVEAVGAVQVQPEMGQFRRLSLRPRSTLHSPGSIPARLGGSGTDFWGVREYHPGDSLRWLDWRLTARHPGKFFTKEFEQEEIADIGIILDARQKTDLRVGADSLFEHSVSAAASLAEVFLHQGHRVGLLCYSGSIHSVFPGYGKVQLSRISGCLSQVKTESKNHGDSLEYMPLHMFSNQALLIVISPLALSDLGFFPRLRAYGYQGMLISPDPFDFGSHIQHADRFNRLALRAARIERRLELRDIAQLQIPVIDWAVNKPLYPLVRNAIGRSRGQREH